MRAMIVVAALVALGGCGKAKDAPVDNAAGFVPPAVVAPKPLPGQGHSNPLTAYIGRYPGDPVDGVGFYDRTEIANALIAAVPQEAMRRRIASHDAVQTPIFRQGDRIAAHGCQPHDCGDDNWTFLVRLDGTGGEACVHQGSDGGNSRWFAGDKPVVRPGDCPAS